MFDTNKAYGSVQKNRGISEIYGIGGKTIRKIALYGACGRLKP